MKKYTAPIITLDTLSTEEIMFLSVSNNTSPSLYADWNDMFPSQGSTEPDIGF